MLEWLENPAILSAPWMAGGFVEVRRGGEVMGVEFVVIVGFGDILEVMEEGAGGLLCCYVFLDLLSGVVDTMPLRCQSG